MPRVTPRALGQSFVDFPRLTEATIKNLCNLITYNVKSVWHSQNKKRHKGYRHVQAIGLSHKHGADHKLLTYMTSYCHTNRTETTISHHFFTNKLLNKLVINQLRDFKTLLVLEMEYFAFGGQYYACWCPSSYSRQSISRHGIGCVLFQS